LALSLLVTAAESDILDGSLSTALTKAMRIEAKQLVMEWICPDDVCDPECPRKKQQKVLKGCLNVVNAGQIRSRTAAAAGLEKKEKLFAVMSFSEDMARPLEEDNMRLLGSQVDRISKGQGYDDAAKDLARYIVKGESSLEVSAAPTEDGPFDGTEPVRESPPETPSEDGGILSLPILIGIVSGALAMCGGVGIFIVRRRANSETDSLGTSTRIKDDTADVGPVSCGRGTAQFEEMAITDGNFVKSGAQVASI